MLIAVDEREGSDLEALRILSDGEVLGGGGACCKGYFEGRVGPDFRRIS